jgi:hypothetical protein
MRTSRKLELKKEGAFEGGRNDISGADVTFVRPKAAHAQESRGIAKN